MENNTEKPQKFDESSNHATAHKVKSSITEKIDSLLQHEKSKSRSRATSRKRLLRSRDSSDVQPLKRRRESINLKFATPKALTSSGGKRGITKNRYRKLIQKNPGKHKFDINDYNKQLDYLARYGKNFYCPSLKKRTGLRPIYIDGSNVAFSHGQNEQFSVKGLKICIDYFLKRGHDVRAFIPHFRLRRTETNDQKLLHELVTKKHVITTPTLYIQNRRRSPYDDWYIVQSAAANGGIIVSSDNFQDILKWNPNLRRVIEERRLVPTFVDDMLIFPVDPHGNRQNNLEQFLKF